MVDGGRGGTLRVAEQLGAMQAFEHFLVLTGSHLTDQTAPADGVRGTMLRHGGRLHLARKLSAIVRAQRAPVTLVAHRDWLACRLCAMGTRCRLILVNHGMLPAKAPPMRRLTFGLTFAGTRFISVSSDVAAILRGTYHIASDVIDIGVPVPPFLAPPEGHALRLVYCGRFEGPQKRPEVAVHAVHALCQHGVDVQLDLVGDGPLAATLGRLSRNLGIADRVSFRGWVPDPVRYVRMANALILPSRFEGNPRVVLEALTAGRPAFASEIPGTAFLRGTRGVHLVPGVREAGDAAAGEAFAQAILGLWDPSLREDGRFATECRMIYAEARARFSEDRMLNEWKRLLSN